MKQRFRVCNKILFQLNSNIIRIIPMSISSAALTYSEQLHVEILVIYLSPSYQLHHPIEHALAL